MSNTHRHRYARRGSPVHVMLGAGIGADVGHVTRPEPENHRPAFARGTYGLRLPSEAPKAVVVPSIRVEQDLPPLGLSLADLPEAEIIMRAAAHDAAASMELRWRCYSRVLMLLSDRLGSEATAHDLVPQVMDAMQCALPAIPPHADFSLWLSGFVAGTSLSR